MNNINMPGFTAENSLHKSRTQYHMSATRFLVAKANVQPALTRKEGLRQECRKMGGAFSVISTCEGTVGEKNCVVDEYRCDFMDANGEWDFGFVDEP